jgi:hypothetical protein
MAESFASFAAQMGIKDDSEGLLTQAKQLWDMLDDMAATNPEGYRKFLAKQAEEAKKLDSETAAPAPRFALRLQQVRALLNMNKIV